MERREALKGMGMMAAALAGPKALAEHAETAVFELRVYRATEGNLGNILTRFRDHTVAIFARHGIKSVAYWVATDDGPLKGTTLFYMLKYPSRAEATAMWTAFTTDPEWVKVRAASEANGKIVDHADSTFLELTDFSPKL